MKQLEGDPSATAADYRHPRMRSFNRSLLRSFHAMQRQQFDAIVWLDSKILRGEPTPEIFLEHCQDNVPARVIVRETIEDGDKTITRGRFFYVTPINSRLIGLCPERYDNIYLSCKCLDLLLFG